MTESELRERFANLSRDEAIEALVQTSLAHEFEHGERIRLEGIIECASKAISCGDETPIDTALGKMDKAEDILKAEVSR